MDLKYWGDAYGKLKWTKIGCEPSNLLHIHCPSTSYPLWYKSEIYDMRSLSMDINNEAS